MSERKPHLWCLFNKAEDRLIEGLLFDEARAFISNLNSSQLDNWYAWKEEWPDWRLVSQVEGLTEMIYRVLPVSPPPPPKGTEESSIQMEIEISKRFPQNSESDALLVQAGFTVRDKKRFKKRMAVTILLGDQSFKTFTRDISVGGMNLEQSLPDWVNGQFKARLAKTSSKQQVELTCCLIDGQKSGSRYRVAILPLLSQNDEQNLEMWLAA